MAGEDIREQCREPSRSRVGRDRIQSRPFLPMASRKQILLVVEGYEGRLDKEKTIVKGEVCREEQLLGRLIEVGGLVVVDEVIKAEFERQSRENDPEETRDPGGNEEEIGDAASRRTQVESHVESRDYCDKTEAEKKYLDDLEVGQYEWVRLVSGCQ